MAENKTKSTQSNRNSGNEISKSLLPPKGKNSRTVSKQPVSQTNKPKNTRKTKNEVLDIKEEKVKNSKRPVNENSALFQLVPYFLAFAGFLLIICLIFPDSMNFLGLFAKVLIGLFSYAAWAMPLLLVNQAVFWKTDAVRRNVKYKAIYAIVCVLCLSSIFQLFYINGTPTFNVAELYNDGVIYQSGGAVGGLVGNVLYYIAGGGAAIIAGFFLLLFGLFLFGFTPSDAFIYIKNKLSEAIYDRKEEKIREMRSAERASLREAENAVFVKPETPATYHLSRKKAYDLTEKKNLDVEAPSFVKTHSEELDRVLKINSKADSDKIAPDIKAFNSAKEQESNGEINLKDIFTEDAVIAAGGHTTVATALENESPVKTDNSVPVPSEPESSEEEPASLEVENGKLKVEAKPTAEELYRFPSLNYLAFDPNPTTFAVTDELKTTSKKLVETLANFGVRTKIMNICCGPTVTRYELQPEIGVRVRSIQNLSDDIALHLAASGVRIEAPIPGKDAVGIEIPNTTVSIVFIRNLIENPKFAEQKSRLSVCLGMDVAGSPIYIDLAKMPHLLIAGATGMGKSVCINSFIVSILYKARPDEVKFILIDPKKVELSVYNGIPHLLVPVVSDPKKAAGSLSWAVNEMERRFALIEEVGVRDIAAYNKATAEDPEKEFMPQVVIIIDELADLMMTARDDVENSICRLAQKARAAGMHLVIGTQRPSVDVITGIIKANIPSRIAFTVASQVDSRTIIDIAGAEKLMGRGDMLFAPVGCMKPIRVQGSYVNEKEVEAITEFLKNGEGAIYDSDIIESIEREAQRCGEKKRGKIDGLEDSDKDSDDIIDSDPMIMSAIEIAVDSGSLSTSLLQRRLSLGYARAARIVDKLEQMGIVGAFEGSKPRKVLISRQQYLEMKMRNDDDKN